MGLVRVVRDLAAYIRMEIISVGAHPIGSEVDSGPGWSITGVITTSHICVHTWPETGYAMIDVVSCKPYSHDDAIRWLGTRLRINRWHKAIKVPESGELWATI